MYEKIRGYAGCGLSFALLAGCFDPDQGHQAIAAIFGVTWGGIWINHA
jgi:hypothetical protein